MYREAEVVESESQRDNRLKHENTFNGKIVLFENLKDVSVRQSRMPFQIPSSDYP